MQSARLNIVCKMRPIRIRNIGITSFSSCICTLYKELNLFITRSKKRQRLRPKQHDFFFFCGLYVYPCGKPHNRTSACMYFRRSFGIFQNDGNEIAVHSSLSAVFKRRIGRTTRMACSKLIKKWSGYFYAVVKQTRHVCRERNRVKFFFFLEFRTSQFSQYNIR